MLTYTVPDQSNAHRSLTSSIFAIDAAIELADLQARFPANEVGVEFYSDADGGTVVTPTEGSVTVDVYRAATPSVPEAPAAGAIDAANPTAREWSASTTRVVLTPAGINGATHYRARMVQRATEA